MNSYHWVPIDTGYAFSDKDKPFGYKTQGYVNRVVPFGEKFPRWLARVNGTTPVKKIFDERDDAMAFVEVVVKLR